MKKSSESKNTFCPDFIRDVSERVYRARLEQSCPGDVARMVAKDEDSGEKLRGRAGFYDGLTRVYLATLGIAPRKPNDAPVHLSESEAA